MAAGRHDGAAPRGAAPGPQSRGEEAGREGLDLVLAGGATDRLRSGIVGYEVDKDASEAFAEGGQPLDVGRRVVEARDEAIVEAQDEVPALGVVAKGVGEFGQGPAPIDGHDAGSQLVGRRVEADREVDALPGTACEEAQPLDVARRTDRDPVLREPESTAVQEDFDGREDFLRVIQRLAHAHEHDIVEAPPEAESRRQHLRDYLAGAQRPDEALASGLAERAAHSAADLRRDAEGRPPLVRAADGHRDAHALDRQAILEAE